MTVYRESDEDEADDDVVEVVVEYAYHRTLFGARDSLSGKAGAGPPIEPDEPAHVEIQSVTMADTGEEVELSDDEARELMQRIEAAITDDLDDHD